MHEFRVRCAEGPELTGNRCHTVSTWFGNHRNMRVRFATCQTTLVVTKSAGFYARACSHISCHLLRILSNREVFRPYRLRICFLNLTPNHTWRRQPRSPPGRLPRRPNLTGALLLCRTSRSRPPRARCCHHPLLIQTRPLSRAWRERSALSRPPLRLWLHPMKKDGEGKRIIRLAPRKFTQRLPRLPHNCPLPTNHPKVCDA